MTNVNHAWSWPNKKSYALYKPFNLTDEATPFMLNDNVKCSSVEKEWRQCGPNEIYLGTVIEFIGHYPDQCQCGKPLIEYDPNSKRFSALVQRIEWICPWGLEHVVHDYNPSAFDVGHN